MCVCVCVVIGADGCIPLIISGDVCQCCRLLAIVSVSGSVCKYIYISKRRKKCVSTQALNDIQCAGIQVLIHKSLNKMSK